MFDTEVLKDINFYSEDEREQELLKKEWLEIKEFEELTGYSNISFDLVGVSSKDASYLWYDVCILHETGEVVLQLDIYCKRSN